MLLRQLGCGVVGPAAGRTPTAAVPVVSTPCTQRTSGLPVSQVLGNISKSGLSARHVCHAAVDDASAAAADSAAAAAATAAERRWLREQRRAARQQDEQQSDTQQEAEQYTPASAAADAGDGGTEGLEAAVQSATATAAAAAAARRGSSRLAARRQQRAQLRGANKRRVPDALVPDETNEAESDDDLIDTEGDSDSDRYSDDDEDVFISDSRLPSGADVADSADVETRTGKAVAAAAAAADAGQDAEEAPTQLPQSVMQQAAAYPRQPRKPQQQQQPQQQQESSAPTRNQQQQQRQGQPKGQQQQRSGKEGGQGAEGAPARPEPLELPEANPMYLPVLTDEDLDADPPGHKSGYVAVIGRPNAGKSTLINAIVGQKLSIVSYKPQTTRHRVVGIASDTNYQMILFDTPGIMQQQYSKLDERMMAAVVSSIKAAEVIIAVVDSSDDPQEALAMFQPGPDWSGPPMAVLLNKTDLLSEEQIEELKEWYLQNCRAEKVFVGSALESSDSGVEAIKAWAVDKLPEGPTLYPKSMVSEQPERFFVSEIIREQIFVQYDQELPYSSQVQIADFKERQGAKDYIQAVILVERETQVPIMLGRGGSAIKKLGSAARNQIEEFLGRKVYLELSVQVAPAWRQQADKLKDFGYYDALYVS